MLVVACKDDFFDASGRSEDPEDERQGLDQVHGGLKSGDRGVDWSAEFAKEFSLQVLNKDPLK